MRTLHFHYFHCPHSITKILFTKIVIITLGDEFSTALDMCTLLQDIKFANNVVIHCGHWTVKISKVGPKLLVYNELISN